MYLPFDCIHGCVTISQQVSTLLIPPLSIELSFSAHSSSLIYWFQLIFPLLKKEEGQYQAKKKICLSIKGEQRTASYIACVWSDPGGIWDWCAVRRSLSVCWIRRVPQITYLVRLAVMGLTVERMWTELIILRTWAERTSEERCLQVKSQMQTLSPSNLTGVVAKGDFNNFQQAAQSLSI